MLAGYGDPGSYPLESRGSRALPAPLLPGGAGVRAGPGSWLSPGRGIAPVPAGVAALSGRLTGVASAAGEVSFASRSAAGRDIRLPRAALRAPFGIERAGAVRGMLAARALLAR